MVKFIATTRDKSISLMELEKIQSDYRNKSMRGLIDFKIIKNYCADIMQWIVNSFDISFSCVNQVIKESIYVINSDIMQYIVLYDIRAFSNYVQATLPMACGDKDWPSCKGLLNLSEKEIVEKFSEIIKDEKIKQEIRITLKMETAKEIITVGHLALYYLENLISIENELLACLDDPHGNKHRLMVKFSEELDYCMQVAVKINIKIAQDKKKEAQEAQRRCEERKNNYQAIGKTNQVTTFTYHRGR